MMFEALKHLNLFKRMGELEEAVVARDKIIAGLRARAKEHAAFTERHAITTDRLIEVVGRMGVQIDDIGEVVLNVPPTMVGLEAEDLTFPADLNIGGMKRG